MSALSLSSMGPLSPRQAAFLQFHHRLMLPVCLPGDVVGRSRGVCVFRRFGRNRCGWYWHHFPLLPDITEGVKEEQQAVLK